MFFHTTWKLLQKMLWLLGQKLLILVLSPTITDWESASAPLRCKVITYLLRKLVFLGSDDSQMHIILIAKDGFLPGNDRLSLWM